MITGASTPGTNWFLDGLNNIQQQEATTQRQISSGFRVATAADSPNQIVDLVGLNSSLSSNLVSQQNFTRYKAELDTADTALSSGISLVDSARTLGLQGASTEATPELRQTLSSQVQSLIQQVVSLSNTSVGGRYVFSGDSDTVIPFQADSNAASGFSYKGSTASTRQVLDLNGSPIYSTPTAQQIFDSRDSQGQPTSTNVLTALQSLSDALLNDPTAIPDAVTALQNASAYVNQQQSGVGVALQSLAVAQQQAATQSTSLKVSISAIRDTDMTQAAVDLNMEKVAESAALAAQGGMSHKSLFDFLG